MTCREALARLTGYLDGELDGDTASAIRGHLRVCGGCRTCAEDHASIRDALADLDRPVPPPAVWQGVLTRLGEAEIVDGQRTRWARLCARIRPHLIPAGVAAAACTAAAVLIHVRHDAPLAATTPGTRSGETHVAAPSVPGPVSPPPVTRDAAAELADEADRVDSRYRDVAAELLGQIRGDLGDGATRRRFERRVAVLEQKVLSASVGRPRDRAWHDLLGFLERAALGELVAEARR